MRGFLFLEFLGRSPEVTLRFTRGRVFRFTTLRFCAAAPPNACLSWNPKRSSAELNIKSENWKSKNEMSRAELYFKSRRPRSARLKASDLWEF